MKEKEYKDGKGGLTTVCKDPYSDDLKLVFKPHDAGEDENDIVCFIEREEVAWLAKRLIEFLK
jgi:hypothetical protein